ncbi:hypothetical protein Csa_011310 [Cucumis sativus]|uniref:Uncharacterized protein n=1 Tax=Cucumis sativus TaxID=3659 RepID=A0A0A0LAC7_CUCSA|nr:hypothetical protein Csa_011310 [Cucumis sativus]
MEKYLQSKIPKIQIIGLYYRPGTETRHLVRYWGKLSRSHSYGRLTERARRKWAPGARPENSPLFDYDSWSTLRTLDKIEKRF